MWDLRLSWEDLLVTGSKQVLTVSPGGMLSVPRAPVKSLQLSFPLSYYSSMHFWNNACCRQYGKKKERNSMTLQRKAGQTVYEILSSLTAQETKVKLGNWPQMG